MFDLQCDNCKHRFGCTIINEIMVCPKCKSELDLKQDKKVIETFKEFLKRRRKDA